MVIISGMFGVLAIILYFGLGVYCDNRVNKEKTDNLKRKWRLYQIIFCLIGIACLILAIAIFPDTRALLGELFIY